MKRKGFQTWVVTGLAALLTQMSAQGNDETAAPSMISLQFQAQAANLGGLHMPDNTMKFTIFGSDKKTALLAGQVVTYVETNGVFNVLIDDARLKDALSGSGSGERYIRLEAATTSGSYWSSDLLRFATAPYAYLADKLEAASGDFQVEGSVTVKDVAQLRALSVEGNATVNGDLICRGAHNTPEPVWIQTNTAGNAALQVGRTARLEGSANFAADVTAAYTATYYSNVTVAGNMSCGNGALVKGSSPGFPSMQSVNANGSPPNGDPGFLVIYMAVSAKDSSGMTVTIGTKTYSLRNSQEAHSATDDGYHSVSYTFFVRGDSAWSSTTGDDVTPYFYWVDLF